MLRCLCCVDRAAMRTSDMWFARIDISDSLLIKQPLLHAIRMHIHMPTYIHPYLLRSRHTDAHTHARAQEMLARTRKCSCHFWFPGERCTPQQFPSVCLLFDSEQKTNTKKTATRPFLGSDRVPPTSGGQTDDCCTFLNHMEMHACAHAYAHAHAHIYIFTPS